MGIFCFLSIPSKIGRPGDLQDPTGAPPVNSYPGQMTPGLRPCDICPWTGAAPLILKALSHPAANAVAGALKVIMVTKSMRFADEHAGGCQDEIEWLLLH